MLPTQVVVFIAGTVVIIFGAYYVTYYIGLKASGQNRSRIKNRNINMLDRFAMSKDKSFCLIEIAGKVYVVGVTNQSMTLLDTLDAAKFAEAAAERSDPSPWTAMPGNQLGRRLVNRLSFFLAGKMRRPDGTKFNGNAEKETFAESMKTAHEKNVSRQTDHAGAERSDDPEGEE